MRTFHGSLIALATCVVACSGTSEVTGSNASASTSQECTAAQNTAKTDNQVVGQLCKDAHGSRPSDGATMACLGALAMAAAATANASKVCGSVMPGPTPPGPPCDNDKDCTSEVGAGSVCQRGTCSSGTKMCKKRHANGLELVESCGGADDGGTEGGAEEGGSDDAGNTDGGSEDAGGYASRAPAIEERHHHVALASGASTTIPIVWRDKPGIAPPADLWVETGGRPVLQISAVGGRPFVRAGLDVASLDSGVPYGLVFDRREDSLRLTVRSADGDVVLRTDVRSRETVADNAPIADVVLPPAFWRLAVVSDRL